MRIKEVEKLIGKKNLPLFFEFMKGQTVGMDIKTGEIDYYDNDVHRFINQLEAYWRQI